jgi:hypothetical protein
MKKELPKSIGLGRSMECLAPAKVLKGLGKAEKGELRYEK